MKQGLLIGLFAFALLFTGCGSDNDLVGDWSRSSSYEGRARSGAVCFVIDNYAYVGTGYDGTDALKSFYRYSLDDGWSLVENEFPGEPRREAVAFVANGKAYVGLGVNDDSERLGDMYEFDPSTQTWNETPIDMTNGPSARQGAVTFSIKEAGYIGTGYGYQEGKDRNYLKDFYKYENGIWDKIAFDGEKANNTTAFVIADKAYVVSGENSLKYVWEYDPTKVSANTNGWTRKRDLNNDNGWTDVQRSQAVSFVINGKGYIATGRNSGLSREVWEYDPQRDHWEEKTSLEDEIASREDAVAFSLNNRGFVTTGTVLGTGSYFYDTWEFDPNREEDPDNN